MGDQALVAALRCEDEGALREFFLRFRPALVSPRTRARTASRRPTATLGHTAGDQAFVGSVAGVADTVTSTETATPGAVAKLALSPVPAATVAGDTLTFDVNAVDAFGNLVPTYSTDSSVTVTLSSSDTKAVLSTATTRRCSRTARAENPLTAVLETAGARTLTARDWLDF